MFYFKASGLNDLVHILRSWKYFNHVCHKESHQHTFTIFRPKLSLAELHPDESKVTSLLTEDMWRDVKDPDGRIVEGPLVLKVSMVVLIHVVKTTSFKYRILFAHMHVHTYLYPHLHTNIHICICR